ncbi:MAG: class I SAM-dependent methyltransferase [Patescibacteria group bacterium]|nr:class I SAM-dependent methyltransferase [Patescibacteria group bacterium]MDE2438969.1 class I SAM-dependent methyltransferase [Patescibacteria group bacterium]
MLTNLQYQILKKIAPSRPNYCNGSAYAEKSKLSVLMGEDFFDRIKNKVVVDFGCGEGAEVVEMAQRGAKTVIGWDIRKEMLDAAQERSIEHDVHDICIFTSSMVLMANRRVDAIVSLDAFEHFSDPASVLHLMNFFLKPKGEVFVSFGPTWYHPYGGHSFVAFPWSHILCDEKALVRWRSQFHHDKAQKFSEVPGGLNQMTVKRFEKLVEASPFKFASFETVPIKKLRYFQNRLTREFTTAVIRARLVKRT